MALVHVKVIFGVSASHNLHCCAYLLSLSGFMSSTGSLGVWTLMDYFGEPGGTVCPSYVCCYDVNMSTWYPTWLC